MYHVGRPTVLQSNEGREHDTVQDVVVVRVHRNPGRRGQMAGRLVEDVVEVRLPKPALRDHHLVTAIDLNTDVREVEQVCGRTDRRTHDRCDLDATRDVAAVEEELRETDVLVARSLRVVAVHLYKRGCADGGCVCVCVCVRTSDQVQQDVKRKKR
jgi:hypothetical protein